MQLWVWKGGGWTCFLNKAHDVCWHISKSCMTSVCLERNAAWLAVWVFTCPAESECFIKEYTLPSSRQHTTLLVFPQCLKTPSNIKYLKTSPLVPSLIVLIWYWEILKAVADLSCTIPSFLQHFTCFSHTQQKAATHTHSSHTHQFF